MKQRIKRTLALMMAVIALMTTALPVSATDIEPYASAYLTSYGVSLVAKGTTLYVDYDVSATRTFDEVGIFSIIVHQKQSDGTWDICDGFYAVDHPEFVGHNVPFHCGTFNFKAEAGHDYYVSICAFAGGESGSDARDLRSVTVSI